MTRKWGTLCTITLHQNLAESMLCALWPITDHMHAMLCFSYSLVLHVVHLISCISLLLLLLWYHYQHQLLIQSYYYPQLLLQHWLACISSLVYINAYQGKTVDTFVVALGYFIYMIKDAWEKDKHVHTQENQKYMVHNFMKKMYTEGFELPTSRVKVRHSTTVPLSHTWSWTFCESTKL